MEKIQKELPLKKDRQIYYPTKCRMKKYIGWQEILKIEINNFPSYDSQIYFYKKDTYYLRKRPTQRLLPFVNVHKI